MDIHLYHCIRTRGYNGILPLPREVKFVSEVIGLSEGLVLSCLGDYVSVNVWYDETVVVVGLAVKLAV